MDYFNQESERLCYRKVTLADQKSWEEFMHNNDRLHFLGLDTTKSNEQLSNEWIARQLQRYTQDGIGLLAVIEKTSGKFIGMCGLLQREIENEKEVEIAYSLKPHYWKKGFATEAALQMKKFGQQEKLAPRFISIIHKENCDSISVAKRNGMSPLHEINFMGMAVVIYATRDYSKK